MSDTDWLKGKSMYHRLIATLGDCMYHDKDVPETLADLLVEMKTLGPDEIEAAVIAFDAFDAKAAGHNQATQTAGLVRHVHAAVVDHVLRSVRAAIKEGS